MERALENWSVRKLAEKFGVKLTYRQYPTISDQEVDIWEKHPEPWAIDANEFRRAFLEQFVHGGA
ncbi:hypothetical protein ACFLQ0_06685 [Nitrospinota bacterium]